MNFAPHIDPAYMLARDIGLWVGTAIVIPVVAALVLKLLLPRRRMLLSGRAVLFLMATLALGPGLLVNVILKDHWGRPRPIDVTQFGGEQHFVRLVGSARRLPRQLLLRLGRRVRRGVDRRAGGAGAAAMAGARLWRGARAEYGHGGRAHDGRRAFLHRHGVCRGVHVLDHLGGARPDLSLAAHAAHRRGGRARHRAIRAGPATISSSDCCASGRPNSDVRPRYRATDRGRYRHNAAGSAMSLDSVGPRDAKIAPIRARRAL